MGNLRNKCINCNKETNNNKYCSKKCFNIGRVTSINIACKICNKKFKVEQCELKTKKFCSNKCRNIGLTKPFLIKKCLECNKEFKIKGEKTFKKRKFCSEKCQHDSYRNVIKTKRISRECINCKIKFEIKETLVEHGKGIYCSRKCHDEYLKISYIGEGNPVFGTKHSEERKKQISDNTKKMWLSDEFRNLFKEFLKNYYDIHGHYPGCSEAAKEKKGKLL